MTIKPSQLAEPIPGYVLAERLGQGGFGEVWKAVAPGGIPKAIKFVHGNIHDDNNKTAAQELKSLNRMKSVHHPFILGVERVDVIDGQVVIVMELADRDLLNRQQECQRQGFAGIPRAELLRYMEETAEALDLMNTEYQLQHLDIKPQNLFLVRNHIKVADFGLAKDLEGMTASLSAGITPVYASPETFEGRVSRFCDQYSLAIVYQEMLTGKRPFNGTNARMLLMQHVKLPPDLTPLPPAERPIVERALAKDANQRWPSCTAFVQELRALPQALWSAPEAPAMPPASPTPAVAPADAPTVLFAPQSQNDAPPQPQEAGPDITEADGSAGYTDASLNDVDQTEPLRDEPMAEETVRARDDYSSKKTFIRAPASTEPRGPAKKEPRPRSSSKDETVRVKPSSQTVQVKFSPVSAKASPCPRCGGQLSDPDTLAWCPKCGYFATQERRKAEGLSGPKGVLGLIERWQWLLLGGAALIVVVTFAASLFLPERSRQRAVFGLIELGVAFAGLIVAHIWAMRLACWFADGKLAFGEVARWPILVWKAMFHHLPDSHWPICMSTWSAALALCALFLGGLGYWLEAPRPQRPNQPLDPIAEQQRLEEAAAQARLAERKRKWASEPVIPNKPINLERDLDEVLIAGYVTAGKNNTISAVVLATRRAGKLVYAGTTSQGFTLSDNEELNKKVGPLPAGDIPDDWNEGAFKQVVWLPAGNRLRLVVDHAGTNPDGTINDPGYRRLKD